MSNYTLGVIAVIFCVGFITVAYSLHLDQQVTKAAIDAGLEQRVIHTPYHGVHIIWVKPGLTAPVGAP